MNIIGTKGCTDIRWMNKGLSPETRQGWLLRTITKKMDYILMRLMH